MPDQHDSHFLWNAWTALPNVQVFFIKWTTSISFQSSRKLELFFFNSGLPFIKWGLAEAFYSDKGSPFHKGMYEGYTNPRICICFPQVLVCSRRDCFTGDFPGLGKAFAEISKYKPKLLTRGLNGGWHWGVPLRALGSFPSTLEWLEQSWASTLAANACMAALSKAAQREMRAADRDACNRGRVFLGGGRARLEKRMFTLSYFVVGKSQQSKALPAHLWPTLLIHLWKWKRLQDLEPESKNYERWMRMLPELYFRKTWWNLYETLFFLTADTSGAVEYVA